MGFVSPAYMILCPSSLRHVLCALISKIRKFSLRKNCCCSAPFPRRMPSAGPGCDGQSRVTSSRCGRGTLGVAATMMHSLGLRVSAHGRGGGAAGQGRLRVVRRESWCRPPVARSLSCPPSCWRLSFTPRPCLAVYIYGSNHEQRSRTCRIARILPLRPIVAPLQRNA